MTVYLIDLGLRWFFLALGFVGLVAVVYFDWEPPYKIVAAAAFGSLMLVASLGITVVYNARKAASTTHLQAAE